jgi:hypothetical protein
MDFCLTELGAMVWQSEGYENQEKKQQREWMIKKSLLSK